jgi:hypothetical protein
VSGALIGTLRSSTGPVGTVRVSGNLARGSFWLVALTLAVGAGVLAAITPPVVIQVILIAALGVLGAVIAKATGRPDADMTVRLFWFAFLLRVVSVYVLHNLFFLQDPEILAGDDLGYDRAGTAIADYWGDARGMPISTWPQYEHFVALLYSVAPGLLIVPRLFNAFFGSLAAVFVGITARNLFDRKAGLIAGVMMAILPSFVVWSSLNLKEGMAVLGMSLLGYAISKGKTSGAYTGLLPLLAGMILLSFVRPWILFVAALGCVFGLIWSLPWGRLRGLFALLALAGGLYVLVAAGAGQSEISSFGERGVTGVRTSTTLGESALPTSIDLSEPTTAVATAPKVLAAVALGPFPWEFEGFRQLLSLPEVLVWYALLLPLFRGIRRGLRDTPWPTLPLLGMALAIIFAIALLEGNLGLAFRHRLQAFSLLLVFVGAGWGWRRKARTMAGS